MATTTEGAGSISHYEVNRRYWQLVKETALGGLAKSRGPAAEIPSEDALREATAAYVAAAGHQPYEVTAYHYHGLSSIYAHLSLDLALVAEGRPPTLDWRLPKLRGKKLTNALAWVEEAKAAIEAGAPR